MEKQDKEHLRAIKDAEVTEPGHQPDVRNEKEAKLSWLHGVLCTEGIYRGKQHKLLPWFEELSRQECPKLLENKRLESKI